MHGMKSVRLKPACIRFYFCWIALMLSIGFFPFPDNTSGLLSGVVFFLCVLVNLIVAASLGRQVLVGAAAAGRGEVVRFFLLVAVVFAAVYGLVHFHGKAHIVTSSVASANLLFGATLLGGVLSSAIKRIGELVPVCITAAVADSISVTSGPSKKVIETLTAYYEAGGEAVPPMADFIIVKTAAPGFERLVPLFGVTDWILVMVLSSALMRLKTSDNVVPDRLGGRDLVFLPVSVLALFISLATAQILGMFIPAMTVIACVFLLFLATRRGLLAGIKRGDVVFSAVFSSAVIIGILVLR